MSDDSFRRRVGTTLRGKWTLERLLGVGGMAAVYAAVHKIGRRDAIKILHPEVAGSREIVERFEQEAHAVNRFRHPGAVEVRDCDVTEDGAPFLVMELLEGESLGARVMREDVPADDALRYADELLDVLAAAHAEGIIHRDVKPDNLFVTREGRLKVLDFGIARMLEGSPRALRTAVGLPMGTPHYMPPEQVLGGTVDARADLYAVGATLFRLVARRYPHDVAGKAELLVKVATEPAPPLCSVAPHAPPSLGLVVDRALALRPGDRYPDARTMQGDVRALRRGDPPPFASANPPAARAASARFAPTSAGVASAPARAPTEVASVPARAPTEVASAPARAPTEVAPAHGIAYEPTGVAPAQGVVREPTRVAEAQANAYAPTRIIPGGAVEHGGLGLGPSNGSKAEVAVRPSAATLAPVTVAATPAGLQAAVAEDPQALRPVVPLFDAQPRKAQQRVYYAAIGAAVFVGALLLVGAIWMLSGEPSGATIDPPLPGPVASGDGAPPPGAGPSAGGAGAKPPVNAGPPAQGRTPGADKERDRQRDRDKERDKQRERDKGGKKK